MPGIKQTALAAAATAVLLCVPVKPASAAGPLLFAPWAIGHIILPLVVASAAASAQQAPGPYPPASGYYGGAAGYYATPNYYARPPGYYAPPQSYYAAPQPYYRPALAYAPPVPWFYGQPRGYYSPRSPYTGSYGGHGFYRSGGFAYRRR
jgi:hypothetical protein